MVRVVLVGLPRLAHGDSETHLAGPATRVSPRAVSGLPPALAKHEDHASSVRPIQLPQLVRCSAGPATARLALAPGEQAPPPSYPRKAGALAWPPRDPS